MISRITKTIILFCLLCFAAIPVMAEERDPYQFFFNETWGDFSEEIQTAKAQGKKAILVFFELDECPFCHWMKQNVLNQSEVQAYFREHFLLFPIDIEGDVELTDFKGKVGTQKSFATENRVRATPVFGFFDFEGKRIARYIGRTADADEFMLFGRYVAEGHYQSMPFLRFKRQEKRKQRS